MKKKNSSKTIGIIKEKIVAQHLKKQGWEILHQNKKVLGVEIDLLAKKNKEHFLIEIKSIKKAEQLENILKEKQKKRLKKVVEGLSEDFPEGLRLLLATVDDQNTIEFFEIN